jgi:hypothetical protein
MECNPVKRAILNIAVGKWYGKGQERLAESLRPSDGDQLFWDHFPHGCPSQHTDPYAFKVWAFREAQRQGYDQALWLDASVWAIKPLKPMWRTIEDRGYLFVEDGNRVGHFCCDDALSIMEITRDEAMDCLIPVGACIGLDFGSVDAMCFLDSWEWYQSHGAFKGPWDNKGMRASKDERCKGHRHDISVAGVVIDRLGLEMDKPPCQYAVWSEEPTKDVCVVARGM